MKSLIVYNWEVRDEWFRALYDLPSEQLTINRRAGVGTILGTLLHIVDVEYSWFRAMFNQPDITINNEDFRDLQSVISLSDRYRDEIKEYLKLWKNAHEHELVQPAWMTETYTKGEIIRHLIAHEIHHIGQLSIWVRELGITPVSASFIGRGIKI